MPYGLYPVPEQRPYVMPSAARSPSLALRIRTRWNRARLDRALADGADPSSSPELTLRAAQLTSPIVRLRLAERVTSVLDEATRPERFAIRIQPPRAEIRESAEDLLRLAMALQDTRQPINPRGVARTALLLRDGTGPLAPDSGQHLQPAVRCARLLLDPAVPVARDLSNAA